MTSFKRFESKPVVKIILIYDRLNLWRHRQFITIFYQFLHIRIEIIHGSHMYILFLPRVGLYVSFLPLANARGKTSWHKGLSVIKTIYTYGFHELFLKQLKHAAYCRQQVGLYATITELTASQLLNPTYATITEVAMHFRGISIRLSHAPFIELTSTWTYKNRISKCLYLIDYNFVWR